MKTVLCPKCGKQIENLLVERSLPVKEAKEGKPVLGQASHTQRSCPHCRAVIDNQESTEAKPN
jgi:endogenous inhibitor of DNA gyrase (YacG/DUF329 family)